MNIRQIQKRQVISNAHPARTNGFVLEYVEGDTKDEFGVDYLKCGILAKNGPIAEGWPPEGLKEFKG